MPFLIMILIGLFVATGLGIFLSRETGLMIFSYAGYNVQMSLSTFVFASLAVFIVVYIIFRLLGGAFRLPRNFNHWSERRRHRRSEKYLCKGLLAVFEGDWQSAEKSFQGGASYSRAPLANYLAAARAAQKLGAIERRDHYLRLAHEDSPDAALAIGLTQAKLQLLEKQTEEAYASLKHLKVTAAEQGRVNALLLGAATELKEWPDALRLLGDPGIKKMLPAEELQAKQLAVQTGLLREAGNSGKRELVESVWQSLPRKLRNDNSLIAEYIEARLNFPDTADCEKLLRKCLSKTVDDKLVLLYGFVRAASVNKQIQFAEKLLLKQAGNARLLLTLGRLCKSHSLWGKARSYLQDSINAEPLAEAYQELGLLLEQQGEPQEAALNFKKGLALATGQSDSLSQKLLPLPKDTQALSDLSSKAV